MAKRGKDGEKVLVRVLNIMQGQRYIEICEHNPSQEQFSMVGSPIELLYESLSLQTIKDSFNNYIAVHSIFRMHSSYDQ